MRKSISIVICMLVLTALLHESNQQPMQQLNKMTNQMKNNPAVADEMNAWLNNGQKKDAKDLKNKLKDMMNAKYDEMWTE